MAMALSASRNARWKKGSYLLRPMMSKREQLRLRHSVTMSW